MRSSGQKPRARALPELQRQYLDCTSNQAFVAKPSALSDSPGYPTSAPSLSLSPPSPLFDPRSPDSMPYRSLKQKDQRNLSLCTIKYLNLIRRTLQFLANSFSTIDTTMIPFGKQTASASPRRKKARCDTTVDESGQICHKEFLPIQFCSQTVGASNAASTPAAVICIRLSNHHLSLPQTVHDLYKTWIYKYRQPPSRLEYPTCTFRLLHPTTLAKVRSAHTIYNPQPQAPRLRPRMPLEYHRGCPRHFLPSSFSIVQSISQA